MKIEKISMDEFKNLGGSERIVLDKPNSKRACRLSVVNRSGAVIGIGFRVSPQFDYEFYKAV